MTIVSSQRTHSSSRRGYKPHKVVPYQPSSELKQARGTAQGRRSANALSKPLMNLRSRCTTLALQNWRHLALSNRIGLIADTHMPGTLTSLWPSALAYLQGCDAILHAGDLHTLDVVDELSTIAPVYVSEGNGDIGIIDERVKPAWSLTFGSFSIGMVHHCPLLSGRVSHSSKKS